MKVNLENTFMAQCESATPTAQCSKSVEKTTQTEALAFRLRHTVEEVAYALYMLSAS